MRVRSLADSAALVRAHRIDAGLSQGELALRAGVSRKWINEFEHGKATAELGHVLRVLESLDLAISIDRPTTTSRSRGDLDEILDDHRRG